MVYCLIDVFIGKIKYNLLFNNIIISSSKKYSLYDKLLNFKTLLCYLINVVKHAVLIMAWHLVINLQWLLKKNKEHVTHNLVLYQIDYVPRNKSIITEIGSNTRESDSAV